LPVFQNQLQPLICSGASFYIQFLGHRQQLIKIEAAQGLTLCLHIKEHPLERGLRRAVCSKGDLICDIIWHNGLLSSETPYHDRGEISTVFPKQR
jgi:hypothetical protein